METLDRPLLTFLINALWQVPLMAAAAWFACLVLRNNPARHRHAVWMLALVASLLLPLAGVRSGSVAGGPAHLLPAVPQIDTSTQSTSVAPTAAKPTRPQFKPARSVELGPLTAEILIAAWFVFALLWTARLALRAFRTLRLRRESALFDPSWLGSNVWERAQTAFGLHGVELRISNGIPGPVMTGVWRKTIVIPASLVEGRSESMLLTAVGHEMAHIARHDFPLSLLAELLWLPLAFHPAAWFIHRAIGRTRELATDELVTERLIDSHAYARSLVAFAGEMSGLPQPGVSLGVFDGDILEERIKRLTEGSLATFRQARLLLASGLSALAVCVAVAAGLAISARAQSGAIPEIKLGVDAYNLRETAAAQDHFQRAVNADPDNVNARLFLATATLRAISETPQGRLGPDKTNIYEPVIVQFDEVLTRDPLNQSAIFGLATLGGSSRSQQAHDLLMKLIAQDPRNRDACYTAAVMDWSKVFNGVQTAAQQAGVPPTAQRIPDPATRAALRSLYEPSLEEGYRLLQQALNIDPAYHQAMDYLNLLYRTGARIADTQEEADALTAKADELVKLALGTRKAKGPEQMSAPPLSADAAPSFVGPFVPASPPPPPPPPRNEIFGSAGPSPHHPGPSPRPQFVL